MLTSGCAIPDDPNCVLGADGCVPAVEIDYSGCCPPPLCGNDLCCTFVAFFNLLPSGPLWDYWKAAAISYFESNPNADPAECPLIADPRCPSIVLHAIYTVLKLRHVVHGPLWVALRESNPYTAVTTLDEWLLRLHWEDCAASHCRSSALGDITPYEIWTECGPLFCPPDFPPEQADALKRAIIVSLTRANMGVIKNLCSLNWVIDPLGAALRAVHGDFPCDNCDGDDRVIELYPTRSWMHGVGTGDICDTNKPLPKLPAIFDWCNRPAGIPAIIWPGIIAAECIVRSMVLCPHNIVRICPNPQLITSPENITNIENTILVHTLTANKPVTWSIKGGTDATAFELVGTGLRWLGNAVRDYENPVDANLDNVYLVTVEATDHEFGFVVEQDITVTVVNIAEVLITSPSTNSVPENVRLLHALTASVSVTWAIAGGADAARFEIAGATLRWLNDGTKNFEAPNDSDSDNVYVVQVSATANETVLQTIQVTVTDVDDIPPIITSVATVDNLENTVLAHLLTADESVAWSIDGGADAMQFELSGNTLRWTGNNTKDFETPQDADADNSYIVDVRATDLIGNSSVQTITVTVLNVTELAPWVNFLNGANNNVVLSNSNYSIAPSGAQPIAIAAAGWKRSGKWYFEVLNAGTTSSTNDGFGLAAEGAAYARIFDHNYTMNAIFIRGAGTIAIRGYPSTQSQIQLGTIGVGESGCIAVDLDNWRFWARKGAAGLWNNNASANPETGVGGVDIAYFSQTRLAPMGAWEINSTYKWAFNTGASAFVGVVPAGFTPGWTTNSEAAVGHPTYAALAATFQANTAQIEKGERLVTFGRSPFNDVAHVGYINFKANGKYYVEFENIANNNCRVGFITNTATLTDTNALKQMGAVLVDGGQIYGNDANSGRSITASTTDGALIGAAIDITARKIWFRNVPAGNWNGQALNLQDPSSDIGGVSISNYVNKTMGPMVALTAISSPKQIINTGERPFAGVVPTGFTSGWPLNTNTSLTVVDGNGVIGNGVTITVSSSSGGARAAASIRSLGKFYFEVVYTKVGSGSTGAGLTASGVNSNVITGTVVDAMAVYKTTGNIWIDGANSGVSLGAFTDGQLVCFCIDLDVERAWVRLGAMGNWNNNVSANPATNISGLNIAGLPDAAPAGYCAIAADILTFNFGASAFVGVVPAGFNPGWPA